MTKVEDARSGLAAIAESRERLADAARVPRWRHGLFAGLMGGLVAAYALPLPFQGAAIGFMVAATAFIVRKDRERMGMFINGYRRGRTAWVAYPLLGLVLLGLVAAIVLRRHYGLDWAPVPVGVVVAGISYWASLLWERLYVAELSGGADRR